MKVDQTKMREPSKMPVKKSFAARSSIYTSPARMEYYNLSVEGLIPYKYQARKSFSEDAMERLAESIKMHGIQSPLIVIPVGDGKYEVISGERRLKAAKKLSLSEVPCIIRKNQESAEEIALIENIHREDLHPIELGEAYKQLLERKTFSSQSDIANHLSVQRTTISENIKFSEIPNRVKKRLIEERKNGRSFLREISSLHDEKRMLALLDRKKEGSAEKFAAMKKERICNIFLQNGEVISCTHLPPMLTNIDKRKIVEKLKEALNIYEAE